MLFYLTNQEGTYLCPAWRVTLVVYALGSERRQLTVCTCDQKGSQVLLPLERIPAGVLVCSTNGSYVLPCARCWDTSKIEPEEQTSRRSLGQQVIFGCRFIFQIQILLDLPSDQNALKERAARMSTGRRGQPQVVCTHRGCLQALASSSKTSRNVTFSRPLITKAGSFLVPT